MALRTADEYRASLQDGRRVYFRGKPVNDVTTHPFTKVAVDHAALDYEMANDPEHRDLAVFEEDGRHLSPLATALIKLLAIGTPAEAGPAGAREDVAL